MSVVSTSESSPTSTDHWHPDHNFGFDKLVRHKLMASHWPWNAPIYVPVNRSGLHSLLFKYVRGSDRFLTYGRRGIHLLISFGLALQHLVSPTALFKNCDNRAGIPATRTINPPFHWQ